jgi:hypothetical protein
MNVSQVVKTDRPQSLEVAGCSAKPVLSKVEGLNLPQDESAVADMTSLL